MKKTASKFLNFFLDIFFPSFCVSCKKEGSFLCSDCEEKIEIFPTPSHFPEGSKIGKFYCATEYRQEAVEKLIYSLKYKFIEETKNELGKIAEKHLLKTNFERSENQILIPVPLHKKRLKWRGFNQSESIANEVGKRFNIPVATNILFRERYTDPQTLTQSRKERQKNIKNAFVCKNTDLIKGKELILVDDILTTGATLKECAKELSKHTGKITAIVIAK